MSDIGDKIIDFMSGLFESLREELKSLSDEELKKVLEEYPEAAELLKDSSEKSDE